MHKWTVLTVLLIAVVATVSNAQSRRGRLFRMARPRSLPFQIPARQQMVPAAPVQSYGGGFAPQFNVPAYNVPMAPMMPMMGGRRYLPDGEYHSPHGTATVDGSDISYDSNNDYFPMMGPGMMMG